MYSRLKFIGNWLASKNDQNIDCSPTLTVFGELQYTKVRAKPGRPKKTYSRATVCAPEK